MIAVRNFSSPIRLRRMLARRASGYLLLLLLLPVGLAGQETGQVTLYTPDGSQQRTLSTPMVVDVGLPSPMEAPVSAVVGTGTGTRITDVEVVVSDSAGGQVTTSYADGWVSALAADASQPSAVSLQVFNTHGQLVATLVEGTRPAGTYQAAWDGRDAQGQAVSSGAYIVRLDAAGQQATRKMILIQ